MMNHHQKLAMTRAAAFQRTANARTDAIIQAIAEGRMDPPVPHFLKSKKHHKQDGQHAVRMPFQLRSAKGQYKMIKRWVLEEMALEAQAAGRGWNRQERDRVKAGQVAGAHAAGGPIDREAAIANVARLRALLQAQAASVRPRPPSDPYARPEPPPRRTLALGPRAEETQAEAQARIARINQALLRDLGVIK